MSGRDYLFQRGVIYLGEGDIFEGEVIYFRGG